MKRYKIEYSFKNTVKTWEPIDQDGTFPTVYKSFWDMVKRLQLWKRSNKPISIVNCWEMDGIYTTPHPLSRYSDKELEIMNS